MINLIVTSSIVITLVALVLAVQAANAKDPFAMTLAAVLAAVAALSKLAFRAEVFDELTSIGLGRVLGKYLREVLIGVIVFAGALYGLWRLLLAVMKAGT